MAGNKKEIILMAALEVFREKGFDSTRIIDIANFAGIGKGTVYEYFSSKTEILIAVTGYIFSSKLERAVATFNLIDAMTEKSDSPVEKLRLSLKTFIHAAFNEANKDFSVIADFFLLSKSNKKLHDEFCTSMHNSYRGIKDHFNELLHEAKKLKLIKNNLEVEEISFILVSNIDGLIWQKLFTHKEDDNLDAEYYANLYIRLIQ